MTTWNMYSTLCFTGHRPDKLGGYQDCLLHQRIKAAIHEAIEEFAALQNDKPTFISGMALGVDQWAAEIVLELGYPLIAAIPCPGQASKWPAQNQRYYRELLQHATKVHTIASSYTPSCMQDRNEWMVNNSSYVLAIWDGTSGGTANCVRYAEKAAHHPKIRIIDPKSL